MNRKITTYQDLVTEKQRLKLALYENEIAVKAEFAIIKTRLKPLQKIAEFAERITTKDRSNPLLSSGIDAVIDFLLKQVLFRKAGFIVKLLAPMFVRNFVSHEVGDNKTWVRKITGFLKSKFS